MGARDRLVTDLQAVVADAEELLRATAAQSGEHIERIRARAEQSVRAARAQLDAGRGSLESQVRENPWGALGIAAAAGIVLGLLIGRK